MSKTSIDLSSVEQISRGDSQRKMRYLNQFVELMRERSEAIEAGLKASDLSAIQKVVHSMSPQLKFFEVSGTEDAAVRIQHGGSEMTAEMRQDIEAFVVCVTTAVQDVEEIIGSHP